MDPTIYTSWNAETARALLLSAPLVRRLGADAGAWTERGLRILESLWSKALANGLMCRYFDGHSHVRGLLGDQVWSLAAALAAHTVTGNPLWLERAGRIVEASEALYDAEAAGYRDRLPGGAEPGRLSSPAIPFNDNALMAQALAAFAAVSGETAWDFRAQSLLGRFRDEYQRYDVFASGYGSAALDVLEPPVDAIIVGEPRKTAALRDAALQLTAHPVRVNPIDPTNEADSDRLERLGYVPSSKGTATAYLCQDNACFARVSEPAELSAALAARR